MNDHGLEFRLQAESHTVGLRRLKAVIRTSRARQEVS